MTDPLPPLESFPLESSALEAQQAIADEFAFFSDWSERYQYLIDLGRKLPPMPAGLRTEDNRLLGCQSMVWIVGEGDADRLDFIAASDSTIVSGLIYLALRVYSGRSAQEILATPADYIASIGLAKHLSPTRSNGLAALIEFIRGQAQRAVRQN
jgi:cysteine desulfuration protein SufE